MHSGGKLLALSTATVGVVVLLIAAGIVGNDWVQEERYLQQLERGRRDWGDALNHLAATGRASAAPRILGLLKKECVQIFDGMTTFSGNPLTMVDQQHGLRYYLALLRLGPRAMPAMVKALGDEDIFFAFCVAITADQVANSRWGDVLLDGSRPFLTYRIARDKRSRDRIVAFLRLIREDRTQAPAVQTAAGEALRELGAS